MHTLSFFFKFLLVITLELQDIAKIVQRHLMYPSPFSLTVTFYITIVQYQNQEIKIGIMYAYSFMPFCHVYICITTKINI